MRDALGVVRVLVPVALVTLLAGACSSGGHRAVTAATPSSIASTTTSTSPSVPPTAPPPTVGPPGGHVPPGTPVEARFNPANNIVTAVIAGAQAVGLGPVTPTRYSPDCSPVPNTVVVCRNASYTGGQTSTATWTNACVVQLDPTLGGGARSGAVTEALRKCLA